MSTALPDRDEVLNAIRAAAQTLDRPPSRSEFKSSSGMTEYQVLKHFPSWREAVRAAGLEPHSTNVAIDPPVLLETELTVLASSRNGLVRGLRFRLSLGSLQMANQNGAM